MFDIPAVPKAWDILPIPTKQHEPKLLKVMDRDVYKLIVHVAL